MIISTEPISKQTYNLTAKVSLLSDMLFAVPVKKPLNTFGLVTSLQKLSAYICLEKTKFDSRFFEDPICAEHTLGMGQGKRRRQKETPARHRK